MPMKWIAILTAVAAVAWGEQPSFAEETTAHPASLLVVTPQRFENSLEAYLKHKRADLPVAVAILEKVLQQTKGTDDPERLKRFLFERFSQDRVRYVLLVGDADVLPVRYMTLDRITAPAYDTAFYPSDLYYADVVKADGSFEDWNAARDGQHAGYFGEVRGEKNKEDPINFDGVHYLPELAVGRWPVASSTEVERIARKTIEYENSLLARSSDASRAGLVAVGGWVDSRPTLDRLSSSLTKGGWELDKRYYADGRNDDTPPPTESEVLSLVNGGDRLLIHAGHGTDLGWHECLSAESIAKMQNHGRPIVMISAGCSTARFATLPPYESYVDVNGAKHRGTNFGEVFKSFPPPPAPYQSGRFNPPGLGEMLLRGTDAGAVAYIGCHTGSQPCGLTLLDGFGKAMEQRPAARLGDCWVDAVTYYHEQEHLDQLKPTESWYPASVYFQAMKFMVFGDPSLRLTSSKEP
jgi:hypothetical protein